MPARRTLSHGKATEEVAAMSLNAREEHILGSIEDGLARSDPKLTSMMATFTRLASGEAMPVREKIKAVRLVASLRDRAHPGRDIVRRRACRPGRRLGLPQRGALWLVAVAAVALVAIAVTVSRGGRGSGQGSCMTPWSTVCTSQVSEHIPGSEVHQAGSDRLSPAG
jgi:hypothetical protein